VYQTQDYPIKDYYDIKYNAIFYNHLWPHIALINDFLVSDAYYRSGKQIDFPSVYAPGYAFLSSKVYGAKSGKIYGNENIQLWMPLKSMKTCNVAINHLFGIGKDGLYLVLMNTSNTAQNSDIQLNQDIIPFDSNKKYSTIVYYSEGKSTAGADMLNGKIEIVIPAQSLIVVKVNDLIIRNSFSNINENTPALSDKSFVRIETGIATIGTITGMLINLSNIETDAYIYSNVNETKTRKAILKYKTGGDDWYEKTDAIYPFEFSIPLKKEKHLTFKWISEGVDGAQTESKEFELKN